MPIAMTGCFDLFHTGHRAILNIGIQTALMLNEKLIVLINSDESVKELKGPKRPIENFERREQCVKWQIDSETKDIPEFSYETISFDNEDDLLDLYEGIKPTMIVHGADIKDTSKCVGFNRWSYLFVPKRKDLFGQEYSTTRQIDGMADNNE